MMFLSRFRTTVSLFALAASVLSPALSLASETVALAAPLPVARPQPLASSTQPSPRFSSAASLLKAGQWLEAYTLARGFADPAERRAIQWAAISFGNGQVPAETIKRFMQDAPEFVQDGVFAARLEQALVKANAPAAEIIADLAGKMPRTRDGQFALARAYLEAGQSARATRIVRSIWTSNVLDRGMEERVLAEFGALLDRDAHWARAVLLMMNDRAQAVERLIPYLDPAQASLARARNATSRNDKTAKALLDAVDPAFKTHAVYYLSRAERAREFELWDDAIAWLNKVTGQPVDADEFWTERQRLIRTLLAEGQVKRAYTAAATYRDGPEGRLVEARFHAGWIALSFLKDPKLALPQFTAMVGLATLPDSVSQAQYWLGRTLDALGDGAGARAAYAEAARYGTLYYGQLAREALGQPSVELRPMPAWRGIEASFNATERVRAVRLLKGAGLTVMAQSLLKSFATSYKTGGELLLAARLAQEVGAHHLAISIADTAEKRGVPLDLYNFPKDGLPETRLASVDKAAIYAIARQESRFKVDAVSSAGALGLMQLMPGTARETAGKIGIRYAADRLTSDPAYNALLGSTYLASQLAGFDGSLALAAAAYNAGAGNVRKWIERFGDPRASTIDPVVWVELIPANETRQYVRRVVGNYLVYRARLGGEPISVEDVLRGSGMTL